MHTHSSPSDRQLPSYHIHGSRTVNMEAVVLYRLRLPVGVCTVLMQMLDMLNTLLVLMPVTSHHNPSTQTST